MCHYVIAGLHNHIRSHPASVGHVLGMLHDHGCQGSSCHYIERKHPGLMRKRMVPRAWTLRPRRCASRDKASPNQGLKIMRWAKGKVCPGEKSVCPLKLDENDFQHSTAPRDLLIIPGTVGSFFVLCSVVLSTNT